jgi:hypothetical protein
LELAVGGDPHHHRLGDAEGDDLRVGQAGVQAGDAMTAKLPIRMTGKARKVLVRTGKVSALAKVTFAPSGGAPATESRKLLLKKSRRNGIDDRDRPPR